MLGRPGWPLQSLLFWSFLGKVRSWQVPRVLVVAECSGNTKLTLPFCPPPRASGAARRHAGHFPVASGNVYSQCSETPVAEEPQRILERTAVEIVPNR